MEQNTHQKSAICLPNKDRNPLKSQKLQITTRSSKLKKQKTEMRKKIKKEKREKQPKLQSEESAGIQRFYLIRLSTLLITFIRRKGMEWEKPATSKKKPSSVDLTYFHLSLSLSLSRQNYNTRRQKKRGRRKERTLELGSAGEFVKAPKFYWVLENENFKRMEKYLISYLQCSIKISLRANSYFK